MRIFRNIQFTHLALDWSLSNFSHGDEDDGGFGGAGIGDVDPVAWMQSLQQEELCSISHMCSEMMSDRTWAVPLACLPHFKHIQN